MKNYHDDSHGILSIESATLYMAYEIIWWHKLVSSKKNTNIKTIIAENSFQCVEHVSVKHTYIVLYCELQVYIT